MTTKHTRGPWRPAIVFGLWTVADSDNRLIAECEGKDAAANALLMATAPELLKAAFDMACCFGVAGDKAVDEWWESRVPEYEDSPSAEQIRDAVRTEMARVLTKLRSVL